MENEQMNQQPTYEQLVEGYTLLAKENHQLKNQIEMLQTDKALSKIQLLLNIIDKLKGDESMKSVVDNAKWHINKMLEIPKE